MRCYHGEFRHGIVVMNRTAILSVVELRFRNGLIALDASGVVEVEVPARKLPYTVYGPDAVPVYSSEFEMEYRMLPGDTMNLFLDLHPVQVQALGPPGPRCCST